jgi:hypothetical protein
MLRMLHFVKSKRQLMVNSHEKEPVEYKKIEKNPRIRRRELPRRVELTLASRI